MTIAFGGSLRATTTVYRLLGLDVDAIVGYDVLMVDRGFSVDTDPSTGRGSLRLGTHGAIPIWTPKTAVLKAETVIRPLRLCALETQPKAANVPRGPVRVTLEECSFPGVRKQKSGEAKVSYGEGLTAAQLAAGLRSALRRATSSSSTS